MSRNLFASISIILVSALAFAQTAKLQHYVVLPAHSQGSALPNLEWDKDSYASWNPSAKDIEGLESELSTVSELKIKGWEATKVRIEHPERYFRQYVGVRHGGERRIYINAFCDNPPPSEWRNRFYVVRDGATCYWQAFYDVQAKTFSDLTINPRA